MVKRLHFSILVIITTLFILISIFTFTKDIQPTVDLQNSPVTLNKDISSPDVILPKYDHLGLSDTKPIIIWNPSLNKNKTLHGRFLHITDIHPDQFYLEGSDIGEMCHRTKTDDSSKSNKAPIFGKAMAGCDTPIILMNETFKWIDKNLKDKIDFVMWTGDNIRHDNDRNYPRTEAEIFDYNLKLSNVLYDIFKDSNGDVDENPYDLGVNVIPSIGNNDVFPHNMFSMGPTLQTREFYRIWRHFIPQEQQRFFDNGVSFFTEIIPNKLAVISINTLYLFKSNPLVDNCTKKNQPGYKLLIWFGQILTEMRKRNMKVWIIGHVPPIKKNFQKSCFDKFTLWINEFSDIIIGNVYGHMNIDHFIPVDTRDSIDSIYLSSKFTSNNDNNDDDDEFYDNNLSIDEYIRDLARESKEVQMMGAAPVNKGSYMDKVRKEYYQKVFEEIEGIEDVDKQEGDEFEIKKKKKKNKKDKKKKRKLRRDLDQLIREYNIISIGASIIPTFNPSFRVWEYNITGLEDELQVANKNNKSWNDFFHELEKILQKETISMDNQANDDDDDDELENLIIKNDKTIPKLTNHKLGPAYENQLFTPIRYVQYYINLEKINHKYYELMASDNDDISKEGAIRQSFEVDIEYVSNSDPYNMETLIVPEYFELMKKLYLDDEIWQEYLDLAFAKSGYKD
ncbi:hypothetical protein TBLA_0E02950 [Henningerozyma blattae CBS 6284]|uniref:Endopolyphosphatase n=1 Tax=Henningerozyma blattae (strain ATCC 34711 / CBS 6284 / DSM 70876 / NBRC 10599 / NRRL Y-10934 / UCD 77-7) TaxID=1071380 RepID=I2H4P7_HENB6|nr:hypothetical protein TBLA_0E02950 [Tetrapisispora blattae CBS 6284]CCH61349.1 hypothetical protein TBLA_0E02950 [Tetrapisispora blattae CBS 6284]